MLFAVYVFIRHLFNKLPSTLLLWLAMRNTEIICSSPVRTGFVKEEEIELRSRIDGDVTLFGSGPRQPRVVTECQREGLATHKVLTCWKTALNDLRHWSSGSPSPHPTDFYLVCWGLLFQERFWKRFPYKSHWNTGVNGMRSFSCPLWEAHTGRRQGRWEGKGWGFPHIKENVWGPLRKMETQGRLQSHITWSLWNLAQARESQKSTLLVYKSLWKMIAALVWYDEKASSTVLIIFVDITMGAQLTPPTCLLFNLWPELRGYCGPPPGGSSLFNPLWIYLKTHPEGDCILGRRRKTRKNS